MNFLISKKFENRKHSSRFEFSIEIPNLIDVQRNCFYTFIENGIKSAFQKSLYFSIGIHYLEIQFFPESLQYQKPDFNPKEAFILGKTYGSSVYIPIGIKSNQVSDFKVEWLFLGVLPLMSKNGHFLVDGVSRVVLHQMVRIPGVYLIPGDLKTQLATIRIIPEKGGWITLTVDADGLFWFHTRTLPLEVSLLVFLQALGFSESEIFQRLRHSEILRNSSLHEVDEVSLTNKKKPFEERSSYERILIRAGLKGRPQTQHEAWQYLYAHFLEYSFSADEKSLLEKNGEDFFKNTLWNKKTLILGKIGRQQFREKTSSPEPLTQYFLTHEDVLGATQMLLNFLCKEQIADDIDSLTQKRFRGCDEFLLQQVNLAVRDFEIFFTKKIHSECDPESDSPSLETLWQQNKIVFSKTVSRFWRSFFTTSGTLSQFMDQINPLAEMTHKRRITVLGPGGVTDEHTALQIRSIHPTYYGRLCPIETPEGKHAGLVNSFTVFARPLKNGSGTISTPLYQVYKGQVQKELSPFFLSPHQDSHHSTAPADVNLSKWNVLPKLSLPVRKELNFEYEFSPQITTQSVGILQNLSVATSLIPFLEHDDATRALMGSTMQRQAVPLLRPQSPYVGTGLETRVVSDVNHLIPASQCGYVIKITASFMKTLTPLTKQNFLLDLSNGVHHLRRISFLSVTSKFRVLKKLFSSNFLIVNRSFSQSLLRTSSLKFFDISTNFGNGGVQFLNLQKSKISSLNSHFFFSSKFYQKTHFVSAPLEIQQFHSPFFSKIVNQQKQKTTKKIVDFLDLPQFVNKLRTSKNKCFCFFDNLLTRQKQPSTNSLRTVNETIYPLLHHQRTNQSTCVFERPIFREMSWVEKGDVLADGAASSRGKLSIGQNILVAYLPWEGYNFEDAILISQRLVDQEIFTSLHIDHYDVEVQNTEYGLETLTNEIPLQMGDSRQEILKIGKLNSKGLVEIGSWVEEGDYLVGKITPFTPKTASLHHQYKKLYNVILQHQHRNVLNTSLRVPKGVEGFVLDVQNLPSRDPAVADSAENNSILRVRILLLQRRKIQVGDKMAGRHGNKGIVSKILPCYDMPYLPDGTPVDIVLNPLGVPSRMNVGQILECLLGLAGHYLRESYTTSLFDEQFGAEASRSLVYSKLYQASIQTFNSWLFEPHHPGKIQVFDGRSGIPFDQPVTVGYAYILKLVHLVDDKIHARATGPYHTLTQQPVKGRSKHGGQRVGEMEVWALQAYGAAHTLQELLLLKSDDVEGREMIASCLRLNKPLIYGGSEGFKLVLRELQALCFDLELYESQGITNLSRPISTKQLENLF